jgi:hypothetical protein
MGPVADDRTGRLVQAADDGLLLVAGGRSLARTDRQRGPNLVAVGATWH